MTSAVEATPAKDLAVLLTGRWVPGCENPPHLIAEHEKITGGALRFRFPPEPNGFLHIGHAKSMNLNFGSAVAHNGKCFLRYDDTNPDSEDTLYIDAIKEMVEWMGWRPDWITHTSDYFDQLYFFALKLIREGKAYVDHSTQDELRAQRENKTESPWRSRTVEENLKLFERMRRGLYGEGEATLRCKIDMQHVNPNMRDFIAYRVKFVPHNNPKVGSKWCIYPSYDFSHCLADSIEHIDFSLCTLEFETRRESYFWLVDQLDLFRSHVWEFSRLNVTGALLSKRKINCLVKNGIARGFDDPRLLTLAGMRRRGYTPRAINNFCELVGITRTLNVIQISMLENCLREELDEHTPRKLGVVDPVRLVIENWKGEVAVECPNHPKKAEMGKRVVMFTDEIFVDRSDFREVDQPKFFGLAPGKIVGLKYSGNLLCKGFDFNDRKEVVAIRCDIDFDRKMKPKTNISWASCKYGAPVEVRSYTPLLTDDKAAVEPDFMKYIDPASEKICQGVFEPSVYELNVFESCQIERFGYYCVDPDTTPKQLVVNRVISLKEDKEKGK